MFGAFDRLLEELDHRAQIARTSGQVTSTDLLVYGLCAVIIVVGIAMIRRSQRERGMGAIGIVLGVIGLLAYITAEEGAPPPGTATSTVEVATTASATPAP